MFEEAVRNKYRFPSRMGHLTVEDLFDLKVEDLDEIFKNLNAQKKQSSEESLLEKKSSEETALDTKIELVKYIVTSKLEDQQERLLAKERAEKKQRIMAILKDKQDQSLQEMSEEDLQKMLDEL